MMADRFFQFIKQMQESEDYLKMEQLEDGHSYKIWARNACVGVWLEDKKAFLISRYKAGPNPYLFHEYHWDIGSPLGPPNQLNTLNGVHSD